jgi:hypothetical protein
MSRVNRYRGNSSSGNRQRPSPFWEMSLSSRFLKGALALQLWPADDVLGTQSFLFRIELFLFSNIYICKK